MSIYLWAYSIKGNRDKQLLQISSFIPNFVCLQSLALSNWMGKKCVAWISPAFDIVVDSCVSIARFLSSSLLYCNFFDSFFSVLYGLLITFRGWKIWNSCVSFQPDWMMPLCILSYFFFFLISFSEVSFRPVLGIDIGHYKETLSVASCEHETCTVSLFSFVL